MSGTAQLGSDYTLDGASGVAVIPAGSSQVVITLSALQDAVHERAETAKITLQAGAGYILSSTRSATITLLKN